MPDTQRDDHALIINRVAQTVQTADRGHHDHIPALKQRGCGTVAQAVDLLVDGGILLDIGIRVGNIGLRLIIIVIRNKVFHRIFREKLPKFAAKLSSQRFVVRQNQGGAVQFFDDRGHGKGLTGAGDTQ